jgi:antitoxin HicB
VLPTSVISICYRQRDAGVRKADLARRLGWHAPQVDRLLDLDRASRLDQLEAALAALGKRLSIELRDAA